MRWRNLNHAIATWNKQELGMNEDTDQPNWEYFFEGYFDALATVAEKKHYPNGLTLHFTQNNIYVWCDLSLDRMTIKKLEFGRLIVDAQGATQSNWIKGVFVKGAHNATKFYQTSYDGESYLSQAPFTLRFSHGNTNLVKDFLRTPCLIGWRENEYLLDKDLYYKVVVQVGGQHWTIKLKGIEEQDLPFLYDPLMIWLRTTIADASWNKKRRTVVEVLVQPMKG